MPGAFWALRSTLPVYLFTGERDPVNHNLDWFHPLVQRMRGAGLRDVTVTTYAGARHEVLNEVNRGGDGEFRGGWRSLTDDLVSKTLEDPNEISVVDFDSGINGAPFWTLGARVTERAHRSGNDSYRNS